MVQDQAGVFTKSGEVETGSKELYHEEPGVRGKRPGLWGVGSDRTLAWALSICVALDKLLSFSKLQFLHLQEGFPEIMYVECSL